MRSHGHSARCHNHKFDPIEQDDYYRLQAVFAAIDRAVALAVSIPIPRPPATATSWSPGKRNWNPGATSWKRNSPRR